MIFERLLTDILEARLEWLGSDVFLATGNPSKTVLFKLCKVGVTSRLSLEICLRQWSRTERKR